MKKVFMTITVFLLVLVSTVVMKKTVLADESDPASSYEAVSQEAERNRELLEIWKDHVKTLTKERDAAFKEVEQLKAAGPPVGGARPMAQFGGVETQPIVSPEATGRIQSLQSEVSQLRAQLEERSQQAVDDGGSRDLQMQFSALQSQLQQVKKDLAQAKSEKDRLIQEKEKALSQVERLTAQNQTQAAAVAVPSAENEENARQARSLSLENDTLKAKVERLQVVEKELESTRAYFTPLMEDLQKKNQQLSDENDSMKSELVKVHAETDGAAGQADQYFTQLQKTNAQVQEMKSDQDESEAQITTLKSQLRRAENDRDRYSGLQGEYDRLASENKSLNKAYSDLENGYKSQQAKYRGLPA